MVRPSSRVLAVALALSAGANVWLLLHRDRGGRTTRTTAATPKPRGHGADSPPPDVAPGPGVAATVPARAASPPALPATCPEQLVELEARLTDVERMLDDRLRPNERFERGAPSPDADAQVRPFFERAFAGAPERVAYDVECRGSTCRLEVTGPEAEREFDWMSRVQDRSQQTDVHFRGMSFHVGTPGQDPVSGEPLFTSSAFFTLADDQTTSGLDVLGPLVERYVGSPEVAACKAQHPTPGYLSVKLAIDAEHRRIEVYAGGTLAIGPGGICLRAALETMVAATEIPRSVMTAAQYFTLRVP